MLRFSKAQMAKMAVDDAMNVEWIDVDRVRPNPYQPRKHFSDDALTELSNSILKYGLLQPINVRRTGPDMYELIAGERRLRATRLAGLRRIKAIVLPDTVDQDSAMLAMIENLQRENLHFFEEAEGYQSLIREHGFTQEELASRMSKNQSTIANKLRILKLPRTVKDKLLDGNLTERHARALLRLHNEDAQLALIDRIVRDNLSVKATEELVERELCRLYGEVPDDAGKVIKFKCNHSIYVNSLKKAYEKIAAMGVPAQFGTQEEEQFIDVTIRLYK